jgi:hypothetical protein
VEANIQGSVIRQTAIFDLAGLAGLFIGMRFISFIAGFSAVCCDRLQLWRSTRQKLRLGDTLIP